MSDHGLQFLKSNLSDITQINLMVQPLVRNIQLIALLFHELMTGLTTGVLNAVLSLVRYDVSTLQTNEALRTAMPWVFIGVETLCYVGIFLIFLRMDVEKYGEQDHKVIAASRKPLRS